MAKWALWIGAIITLVGGATWTVWILLAVRRDVVRHRDGLCMKCGYDLRHSGDRCPECGEPKRQT
jgi:predicted amidophosphoribosyltransferase